MTYESLSCPSVYGCECALVNGLMDRVPSPKAHHESSGSNRATESPFMEGGLKTLPTMMMDPLNFFSGGYYV